MMIHYHGTPVSGPRQDTARFLTGRHALVPFPRQDDMGVVAEFCHSFVFDNGAFSVWKQGGKLDVPGYIKWCEEWYRHSGFDWALIPDTIDGTSEDNDAMVSDWPTHIRGVPVWHLHESIDRLVTLANQWPIVALGSSGQWDTPGTADWWDRINDALPHICDHGGRPMCRLHGLRMLNPKVFTKLPLSSADSTNAAVNCNGSQWDKAIYKPATAWQRATVIADRVESFNSSPVLKIKYPEWLI